MSEIIRRNYLIISSKVAIKKAENIPKSDWLGELWAVKPHNYAHGGIYGGNDKIPSFRGDDSHGQARGGERRPFL